METNPKYNTIYRNVAKNSLRFAIEEREGIRDYSQRNYLPAELAAEINDKDKLLLITADPHYPFTTDDIGEMAYRLLINKILPSARQVEADKIQKYIRKAFMTELL